MKRLKIAPTFLVLLAIVGCGPSSVDIPPPVEPPTVSRPAERRHYPAPTTPSVAKLSWETDRDRTFAEFLRDKTGGMVKEVAVGIERKGLLRVELDRSVEPADTLPLTKSLMAGARKDFPDRPITLAVFDPGGEPILKAIYKPGEGVKYQIAHDTAGASRRSDTEATSPTSTAPASRSETLSRSGVTDADRKFATWAEDHGKSYLRYVEADLEKHGRLWFGVSREVKPADVPELTKSLLEGARKEFPRGELVAKVFDPEGEPIGQAHLGTDGRIRWEH